MRFAPGRRGVGVLVLMLAAAAGGVLTAGPSWQPPGLDDASFVPLPAGNVVVIARPDRSTVEERSFRSDALRRTMPYLVYLPRGYNDAADTRYPVLYMLHGMAGSMYEWAGYGLLDMADRLIGSGEIAPLLIVMPQGDDSYWIDHAGDGPRWGAYVAEDLVTEIDSRFRSVPEPAARAVGGLSMGGFGALTLAITHPEVFGVAGAHGPSLRRSDDAPAYFGDRASFDQRDPVVLYDVHVDIARALTIWLDTGEGDPWLDLVRAFHEQLEAAGIAVAYAEFPGGHDNASWIARTFDCLRFYSAAFSSGSSPIAQDRPARPEE
jgi:putative tributyrin esterase